MGSAGCEFSLGLSRDFAGENPAWLTRVIYVFPDPKSRILLHDEPSAQYAALEVAPRREPRGPSEPTPNRVAQENSGMPTSTFQDASSPAAEPDVLTEDGEPVGDLNPSRAGVVLSAQAKERLRLLNRVLANCVPHSMSHRESDSRHDQLQQG